MFRRMGMVGELIGLCTVASDAVVCDANVWAGFVRLLRGGEGPLLPLCQCADPEHGEAHVRRDRRLGACRGNTDRAWRSAGGPDARSSEAPNTGGIQASGDAADG